jgi:hypothetical protein
MQWRYGEKLAVIIVISLIGLSAVSAAECALYTSKKKKISFFIPQR